jgi:ComF family protein
MRLGGLGRALVSTLLDVLAPPRCVACEAFDPQASGYCAECGTPEPLLEVACHIDRVPVFAGARYAEPVASVIQRFKYGAAPELCGALAELSLRGIDLLGIEPGDVWVPVPLHPLRLAERGYNQAALLARELSRSVHGRVDARRLRRLRHTEQQAKQNRRGRADNVESAFAARERPGKARRAARIVLVDDVVTTGATLRACIRALRAAGDEVVGCMAVASADAALPAQRAPSRS